MSLRSMPFVAAFAFFAALPADAAVTWQRVGPNTGLVTGVSFAPGSSTIAVAAAGGGIYRTTDGGANWSLVFADFLNSPDAILFDPSAASRVFLTINTGFPISGVFVSNDGGVTYTERSAGLTDVQYLALAASADGARVYVGGGNYGVFVSTDNGVNWTAVPSGLPVRAFIPGPPPATYYESIQALAVDPSNPLVVYAAPNNQGVYKSVDGGASWLPKNTGLGSLFVKAIAVDPVTPTTLYASAGAALYKSVNGGDNWTATTLAASNLGGAVVVDPADPLKVRVGSWDGAIHLSVDGGTSWTGANGGIAANFIEKFAISGADSNRLIAATRQGLFFTTDGGASWLRAAGLTSGYIQRLVRDPTTASTLYAATEFDGVFKSIDGGQSFTRASTGLPPIRGTGGGAAVHAITTASAAPNTLYAGLDDDGGADGDDTLWRSTDGAASWIAVGGAQFDDRYIYAIGVAPSNAQVLYVASSKPIVGFDLVRSADAGASWASRTNGLPASPYVTALAVSPLDPDLVLLGSGGDGAFRSIDGGVNWTRIDAVSSTGTVESVEFDPLNPTHAYISMTFGIKKSTDSGATWTEVGPLYPGSSSAAQVKDIAFHPTRSGNLLASAIGAGAFLSYDGGANWTQLTGFETAQPSVLASEFDATTPGRILAAVTSRGVNAYQLRSDLSLTLATAPGTVAVGDAFNSAFTLINLGPDEAPGVSVTVTLDPSLSNAAVALPGGSCVAAANVHTCTLSSARVSIGHQLTVSGTTTSVGSAGIATVATLTSDDPVSANDQADASVTVRARSTDLALSVVSFAPSTVTVGAVVAGTLTVANLGPDAVSNVTVVATFDASLTGTSVALTGGTCSAAANVHTCTLPALAFGANQSLQLSGTAPTAGTVAVTVSASSATADPVAGNNSETRSVTVVEPVTVVSGGGGASGFELAGVLLAALLRRRRATGARADR